MQCAPWALPVLIVELCTLCGRCVAACPNHGIRMGEAGPIFEGRDVCDACGTCEDVCAEGAIVTCFEIIDGESQLGAGGSDAESIHLP